VTPRRLPLVPALRLGVALAVIAGCGRQDLDLLVPSSASETGGGADSGPVDLCSDFVSQQECQANSALGCSFQPNVVGCRSDDPSCRPGSCGSGDPFVRRVGKTFLLNGETFRFAGVSSWALQSPRCLDFGPGERQAWLQRAYDDLIPARAKVARLFAFQESAGPSGNDFTLFDMSVREARRAGVRLLLVLEHRHGTCSHGAERDEAWYAGGYQQAYGGYALSYRDYARAVAERYRDEPTVLGYVLLQDLGGADAATLAGFITDMGELLHSLAPSQLVSLDLNWTGDDDPDGADYRQLQSLPAADFIDVQDYLFDEPPQPLDHGFSTAWLSSTSRP
jgi:hypothetical protein